MVDCCLKFAVGTIPSPILTNFVVASAKLSQIKIVYNLNEELSLHPKKAEVLCGPFSHPSCMSSSSCSTETTFLTTIRLLDHRFHPCPSLTILQSIENKITIYFVTCFSQNVNTVCWYLKQENITQWAQVQQLAGGISCMHRNCSSRLRTLEMLHMSR